MFESLEENYSFDCPHCGETNDLLVDFTAGQSQRLVVDCSVCCHPIVITLEVGTEEVLSFEVQKE